MKWRTAPLPAHVAPLPIVCTNGLAGVVLAGGGVLEPATLPLLLALALLWLGGEQLAAMPTRPLPLASPGMMAAALLLLLAAGLLLPDGTGPWPAVGGAALAVLALARHAWPQQNMLGQPSKALWRALAYLTAGLIVTTALPAPLLLGAGAVFSFTIGSGYVTQQKALARPEDLWPLGFVALPVVYGGMVAFGTLTGVVIWLLLLVALGAALRFLHRRRPGDVGRAASLLVAATALLDALLIAGAGEAAVAWLTLLAFPLTLALQRR